MNIDRNAKPLTAAEVLRRYKDDDLPAFVEVDLKDVNQVGNFGDRPIHIAAVRGNTDEIQALISAGADVNALGDLGNTALHEAVSQGHADAIRLLLANGASRDARNEFGQTPFDIASRLNEEAILKLLR